MAMVLPAGPVRRFNGFGLVVKMPRLALPVRYGI